MPDALTPSETAPSTAESPLTARRPIERTFHGDTFIDDYEWLRRKDDPDVVAHLEAQNAWTLAQQEHLAPLRQTLFDEIKGRTLETDLSVPSRDGDWWYYARTVEGQQYPIHARYRAAGPDDWTPRVLEPGEPVPGEQLLLDQNVQAEGHDFFALGSLDVSDDGARLLHATDTAGDERYTLRVRDLATGEDLPDEVRDTAPGAMFSPDGEHIFYLTVDDAWRPWRVWRHRLGTPSSDDVLVFEEPDERYWVGVGLSRSKKYLQIELGSKVTSESWLLESDDPTGEFRVVWPRREGVEYTVEHAVLPASMVELSSVVEPVETRDVLLILHNKDALNFELVSSPVPAPGDTVTPEVATVVVAHDPDVRLEGVSASERYLVLYYRREAISRAAVLSLVDPSLVGRACRDPPAQDAPGHLELPGDLVRPAAGVGRRGRRRVGAAQPQGRLHVVRHAAVALPVRRRLRRAHPAQAAAGARRLRPRRLRPAPRVGDGRGRHAASRSPSSGARTRCGSGSRQARPAGPARPPSQRLSSCTGTAPTSPPSTRTSRCRA